MFSSLLASISGLSFISKTGKELETVVQLKVDQTAPSALVIPPGHPTEICAVCGRTKYHPWVRGFFPSFKTPPTTGHIWKTQETFGGGGSAWNATIISSVLYQEIQKHKLAGLSFMPMAPS